MYPFTHIDFHEKSEKLPEGRLSQQLTGLADARYSQCICDPSKCKKEDIVPIIRVEMWEGRTLDQKRELVEVLSKETARITGCSVESVYVVIEDVKKVNWGAGGQLCSDKYPD